MADIEPTNIIQTVDMWIDKQLNDAAKYDNCELLDSSSCWSLHQLARTIYAHGVADGAMQERERASAQHHRDRKAEAGESDE